MYGNIYIIGRFAIVFNIISFLCRQASVCHRISGFATVFYYAIIGEVFKDINVKYSMDMTGSVQIDREGKMENRDWERFGEEIRKTVQEAVNSQNFEKLSQTVADTVNDAVAGITNTLKQAGDTVRAGVETGMDRKYSGTPVYEESACMETHVYQNFRNENNPGLYRGIGGLKARGFILTAIGLGLGFPSFILFLILLVCVFVGGGFEETEFFTTVLSLMLSLSGSVVGFSMFCCGASVKRRVRRFQTYIHTIGGREYCNLQELSEAVGKSIKYVAKDVKKMLLGEWLLQGHLDEQGTCLIVSHRMYEEYLMLQTERRRMEESGEAEKKYEQMGRMKETARRLSPEVREIIEKGGEYIQRIQACKEAIWEREISAKISRMETVIRRILDRVEHHPECAEDIRRLLEYYLPTTVKLLEAYQELEGQPEGGENISSSKREIERTLDTLNEAFEKLLDKLFQDTAWDVSSDISVLHTMLAQEGLVDDKLKG